MNSLQQISVRKSIYAHGNIVHRTSISYRVVDEEFTYSKAEIYNLSKDNTPDLPLNGLEVIEKEGREREGRADDVTDGVKDQKWNISDFQSLIFFQYTDYFIIWAPAGKLRRFLGDFDSTPYTLCCNM